MEEKDYYTEEAIDSYLQQIQDKETRILRRQLLIRNVVLAYVFFIVIAFFLFSSNKVDLPDISFKNGSEYEVENQISRLENKLTSLDEKVSALSLGTTTLNANVDYLIKELDDIKTKNDILMKTLSDEPEKALTAVLLSKEVEALEVRFTELKESVNKTNERLLYLFFALLLLPIFGLIWKAIEKRTLED